MGSGIGYSLTYLQFAIINNSIHAWAYKTSLVTTGGLRPFADWLLLNARLLRFSFWFQFRLVGG